MAGTSFEHADDARAPLQAIVSDPARGADALASPQSMANLLQHFLPEPRVKRACSSRPHDACECVAGPPSPEW